MRCRYWRPEPGEVVNGANQRVEDCKDKVRTDDRDKGTGANVDTHPTDVYAGLGF